MSRRWGEGAVWDEDPDNLTPSHERRMLFELASDLQSWPVRNVVVRGALDRAALEVARLAGQAE